MDWKLFVLHNGVHYREDIERSRRFIVTYNKLKELVDSMLG